MSRDVLNRGAACLLCASTVAIAALLPSVGCTTQTPTIEYCELLGSASQRGPLARAAQPSWSEPQVRTIGYSVEGRPIDCIVLGDGPDVSLLLATIHGNEGAGTPLLRRLADHLAGHPTLLAGRRVVLVPVANPDGLAHHTRYNARGVDLNRNFPSNNWSGAPGGRTPLSEPEAQALSDLLNEYQPARITSIHEGFRCVDFDGPAEPLARAMSTCCDLPLRRLGARPGSLGSYAGTTLGRPIVTIELARYANRLSDDELWSRYGEMLISSIEFGGSTLAEADQGK